MFADFFGGGLPAAISCAAFILFSGPASGQTLIEEDIPPAPLPILLRSSIGGQPVLLVLNTFGKGLLLDQALLPVVVPVSAETTANLGDGTAMPVSAYTVPKIQIQKLNLSGTRAVLIDFQNLAKAVGVPLGGGVALDVISGHKVFFDYQNGKLFVHDGAWMLPGDRSEQLPLWEKEKKPAIEVDLAGNPTQLGIDTGLSSSFELSDSLFDKLVGQGIIEVSTEIDTVHSSTGAKRKRKGWFLSGSLMGRDLRGETVLAGREANRVGLSWLSGFNFEIDLEAGILRYQSLPGARPAIGISDTLGFKLTFDKRGPIVQSLSPDGAGEKAGIRVGDIVEAFGTLRKDQLNIFSLTNELLKAAGGPLDISIYRMASGERLECRLSLPPLIYDKNFSGRDTEGAAGGER